MLSALALVTTDAAEFFPHADFSFFNVHTETTSQAIAAFLLMDCVPDMDLLRRRVDEELRRSFRRFTRVVVSDPKLRWAQPAHFDVADHITLRRLPGITDLASLMKEASREFSLPLDMSRPLWQMTVISGPEDANPVTGILFKLHHSLTDGLGALEALYAFCGDQVKPARAGNDGDEEAVSEWGPARNTWDKIAIGVKCARQILFETLSPPIRSPLNGPNSTQRTGCLVRLPRAELRRIGIQLGGSLHDTLMTLLAGALARFHTRTGYPVGDMRAIVPVSIRRSDQKEEMSNLITAVGIRMPIALPSPKERLNAIRSDLDRVKNDGTVAAYRFLSSVLVRLPRKVHRLSFERMFLNTNFLCTIIPGARFMKTLAGAKIELISGFAANNRNHASSFTFVTYCREVSLIALVDPTVVKDLAGLEACIRESWEELRGLSVPIEGAA